MSKQKNDLAEFRWYKGTHWLSKNSCILELHLLVRQVETALSAQQNEKTGTCQ